MTESEVNCPDSPESLVTPRFYRKECQTSMVAALHASAGRSGLTAEQKVEQMTEVQEHLTKALDAITTALSLTCEPPMEGSD